MGSQLWDPNNVGLIDMKSNKIVAEVPTGIRPGPIASGFGSIWVGNMNDRTLTRVDPKTRAQIQTISLGDRTPTGVAAGAGGVWVANGILGSITRVDPQYNRAGEAISVTQGSDAGSCSVRWRRGVGGLRRIDAGPPRSFE